jgi:hypothetical protein
MTEVHEIFPCKSPARKYRDVKNYFRKNLYVNLYKLLSYRLSLQPLPVGAHRKSKGLNKMRLICVYTKQVSIVFTVSPLRSWRLSGKMILYCVF